ncbi:MvdC/MvdD family ATP grasp protein [Actinocorallia aurantiaca]|uniref:ATP-grasp domain-containing protein n=1 Tax=Actinocorallia aurantiaca TaxID=46204 RepID=A0ABN3TWZ7_9ACTN
MSGTILILSVEHDPHARHLAPMLRERGHEVIVFDPARYPVSAGLDLAYDGQGSVRRTLRLPEGDLALDELASVWFRRPGSPVAHPEITEPGAREHVERQSEALVSDVWDDLDCLMVPASRTVLRTAQRKAAQLRLAGRLGFTLPPTLISTDPEEFLDFYRRHDGRVITKPIELPWARGGGEGAVFVRMTERVSTRDVGYADALRYGPIIVQAYVPKRLELRVTVVGDAVFAAEIHSQSTNRTRDDWRRYDLAATPHAAHDLPGGTAEQCRSLVRALGLRYGAIDLILTPEGRYVFLEINPNGQYLWIERLTGLPISAALCDLLGSAGTTDPIGAR